MELVSKPTGFLWGYIYVAVALLNSIPGVYSTVLTFRSGEVGTGVAAVVFLLIIWASLYGILRRRRWGLIVVSLLLALMVGIAAWRLWELVQRSALLVSGYIALDGVFQVVQILYGLFFLIYFLRRRRLFR